MGVSKSAIARVTGCEVKFRNFNTGGANYLPQRLAIIGQGTDGTAYPLTPFEVFDAESVGERFGFGSLLHLAALQLFPKTGTQATFPVTIYPVAMTGKSSRATGALTVAGGTAGAAGNGTVVIGGVSVSVIVTKGETAEELARAVAEEINTVQEIPVTAGTPARVTGEDGASSYWNIPLLAKWSGDTGNEIRTVIDIETEGLSLASVAMEGGAGTPGITDALALFGDVWETFVLNTLGYENPALLDEYQAFAEERWSWQVQRPLLVAHGCTADYAARTAVSDARKRDHANFFVQSTGSAELPAVVGARGLLDILTTADSDPAQNYKGVFGGLMAGSRESQESYLMRNSSVSKGASTSVLSGTAAKISDTVTFWHPDNEGKVKSWRYVVDAVKLMNVVFNIRLINEADDVEGAPLIPDDDVSSHPTALRPKTFRTWYANMADALADMAIIADAKFTKENMSVGIDSENPKRLDSKIPVKLSGNAEVISTDLYFGFYVGGASA